MKLASFALAALVSFSASMVPLHAAHAKSELRVAEQFGIAVALLGRNHPVGVIFAALLFAVLTRGGVPVDAFTQHVTKDIVQILQATIILFVAAEAFFREPMERWLTSSPSL